jgi:hypothetical protein
MANNLTVSGTRDLPTDCRFAQDQTGVLAVFSLYYQRIDRGWPAVQAGGEQGCIDAAQRDRLPVAQRDHRIAVGVVIFMEAVVYNEKQEPDDQGR